MPMKPRCILGQRALSRILKSFEASFMTEVVEHEVRYSAGSHGSEKVTHDFRAKEDRSSAGSIDWNRSQALGEQAYNIDPSDTVPLRDCIDSEEQLDTVRNSLILPFLRVF